MINFLNSQRRQGRDDTRRVTFMSDRVRIEATELGVYVGQGVRRGFFTKKPNALSPVSARRVDARQLASLENGNGSIFSPSSLASERGNLRTDETLLQIDEMTFPTKEGGRVIGDVSLSFRLVGDPGIVRELLNGGVIQQIALELPRRVRGAVYAEVGRWAQRDVVENLHTIRSRCCELVAKDIGVSARAGKLNLGLELINLTVLLRTPDLYRSADGDRRGPDLIADLARAREAWGDVISRADERRIAQMFDGIIRQHLMRTLSGSPAKVFVVPTEATGLLGNFMDMEEMAGLNDTDGQLPPSDGAPPALPKPEGEAA